ncbi:hypothetical protein B1756_07800 [Natrarchaeobaculum aegyptiacum]|uniref:Winged helix-turn-helix domain-containing protein n=2 Tax=Natrarchaeobaculum aegyptiacum TaxID=745377 RepID=A0A2Z2HR81_9EURY|nr:hypothetical protein B1756_07800 [Natrarchaeobaculum aegyptiacum]
MNRKPARWMCTLDERILEYLEEEGWSTPKLISQRMKFNASRGRVEERCEMLAQVGLIVPIYEGSEMYELTGDGRDYLVGGVDVELRPRPSPDAIRG